MQLLYQFYKELNAQIKLSGQIFLLEIRKRLPHVDTNTIQRERFNAF